jgi:abhydrolase domain-containing protein 13
MVDVLMPFLRPIKSIVLRIEWRSDILIQELKQPIMLISGEDKV